MTSSRGSIGMGLVVLLAAGCSTSSTNGVPVSGSLRAVERYCVERRAQDERNLALPVAESLRSRGINAHAAEPGSCPEIEVYRVTYVDGWSWDVRVFLGKFTIEVLDTRTGEILAYGESMQSSLSALGMTYREVIDRAVSALLAPGAGAS